MYGFTNLAAGIELLAQGLISQNGFDRMVRGVSPGNGNRSRPRSKYKPHQGAQECARRVRQMEARRG